jgi:hypothetical protein
MLKQQDELLRISIWQRPNQQAVDQTEHSRGRANRERNSENRDRCKGRLLD